MAFPETVLPLVAELQLDGTWTDITSYVQRRGMVTVTRGRSDEASQVDRSTCALSLDNRDGRFSSRLPTGPYYGMLTRNTPLRVGVDIGDVGLLTAGVGYRMTCPEAGPLGITGDVDVRVELELDNWRTDADLCAKYKITGDQRSWAWWLNSSGTMTFRWSTNGTAGGITSVVSTAAVPVPGARRGALRVTLDVNNGSSGNTVTFYTSDSISGSWTQLGDPVVTAGLTSVFDDASAPIEVGDIEDVAGGGPSGRFYRFELRNGIAGTVVANPDMTIQAAGATSFADTASSPNTWTVAVAAELTARRWRFHGEVSSWPQRWDPTGSDVYVPIEAAGILRRLGQGAAPLASALYRGRVRNPEALVAYWPFEDATGSTSMAAALEHEPMSIIGTPTLASFTGFAASGAIPVLSGAEMRGSAPRYTDTGEVQVRWLMAVPAAGAEDGQTVIMFYTTGSVRRWEVYYGTGTAGSLGLRAFDGSGVGVLDTGTINFAVNGELLLCSVELTQNGANIDYNLATLEVGADSGLSWSGTLNSSTVGRVGQLGVSPGGGLATTAIGHVTVQSSTTDLFELWEELKAWSGETASARVQRLCGEEGITVRTVGLAADSARMGPQRPAGLLELLRECATADAGMLFEPRDVLGLGYRPRSTLYNQASTVPLDYAAGDLAGTLDPTDDDQATRNDVTAKRTNGSSSRAVLEAGALSVQAPPSGVGRYDTTETINVELDANLPDQAWWRLHLGTVDEARYPQVSVNLARDAIAGVPALLADVVAADVGDLVTVENPPAWLPPETIAQLVQGYRETLANFEWVITWNTSPASPYTVAAYGGARYGPVDTVTAEALDTTETGVDINTPTGPLWDTTASGFAIVIGGERMTVTAVGSPTGTAQTLTVVRSVNGVVKSHATGQPVQLYQPAIYAL